MLRRLIFFNLIFFFAIFSPFCHAYTDSGQASFIPWSGHYWPFNDGALATGLNYRGKPSPLEKYLLYTTARARGPAIDWYMDHYYDPEALSWEGLCPAYAWSAVNETYPIYPSVHDNIVFRVGDKKGLLALCHDSHGPGYVIYAYGAKEFHRWLLNYIKRDGKSFAADLGTPQEVWYHPVYAFQMQSRVIGRTEHVTATIKYAHHSSPDYIGTDADEKKYTYALDLDNKGGIVSGRWTEGSVSNHPKILSYPESTIARNPYLDCDTIRKIARQKDDSLERPGNEPAWLFPGTHNLVLLDEDIYTINGNVGDIAALTLTRLEKVETSRYGEIVKGPRESVEIEILDSDQSMVFQETATQGGEPVELKLALSNPPYTIRISQQNYDTSPNIYSLTLDLETENIKQVPYLPRNGPWSGFAITNPSDSVPTEVMLVTYDTSGEPLQTVLEPVELSPGEKKVMHFSNLPVFSHEFGSTESIRILSDEPVETVNLFAGSGGPMAGFTGSGPFANRLVFPEIYDNDPWDPWHLNGKIFNFGFSDEQITFDIYFPDGGLARTVSQTIDARGAFDIRPGSSPFSIVPDGGWMQIYTESEESSLSGYQYLANNGSSIKGLETFFALPVTPGFLYVPHVTPPGGLWQTRLTLVNPHEYENQVKIHMLRDGRDFSKDLIISPMEPFEKRVVDLSEQFGDAAGWSILEISGRYPLAGQVTYDVEKGDFAVFPLLDNQSFKTELVMPHSASSDVQWWTGVGVCNPNSFQTTVVVTPYGYNGKAMNNLKDYIALESGAYEVFNVHDRFPDIAPDISFLKIKTTAPDDALIGGFYLYGNQAAGKDLGAHRLLSGGNM